MDDSYEKIDKITDEGRYAVLLKVEGESSGQKYAVKKFKESYVHCPYILELECLSLLCPYIVQAQSMVNVNGTVGVLLNLAEGDGIWLALQNILWKDLRVMFKQAILAVDYLHRCSILHLDIKPANFLAYKLEDQTLILKLIDFSLSVKAEKRGDSLYKDFDIDRTPDGYRCPEFSNDKYTDKHDIWSLGMSLLYMTIDFAKYLKNFGHYLSEENARTKKDYLLDQCEDDEFTDLIKHMIDENPDKRYSMKDIFDHNFMKGEIRINVMCEHSSSHDQEFTKWCSKKKIDTNRSKLAGIILNNNMELFDGLFSLKYDETLKKMIKWAVTLSLSGELINNYKDDSGSIVTLFLKNDRDVFFDTVLKVKSKFIYRKYSSVFSGEESGLIFLKD
uniref:Putative serine/threonine protein kinase n=1 Tax=Pithovirus LCPAC403 TaxID=2506596 RepID=A0A481ZDW5_9VIRU|nr:MAG: putative serine/threonine protein kinase [Pithovirus LCPAC403]